jgi:hypothetical protein
VARQAPPSGSLERERVDLANRFKVADVGVTTVAPIARAESATRTSLMRFGIELRSP